ncbi:MAG: DUF4214 domain-containing protein [Actinomycetia bacterium]|nr:DUF4214 domain-containing protein [Actinomycetes bacterium]
MAKYFLRKKSTLMVLPLVAILAVTLLLGSLGFATVEVKGADGVTGFVTRMYQVTLDRNPDPSGLASWEGGLRSGSLSGADVAKNFIFSEEFMAKNLNNEQFLQVMYRAFFDRAPDPGGFNGWMSELNSGKSREYVLAGFVNSQEFNQLCSDYGINPGSLNGSGGSTRVYAHEEVTDMQAAAPQVSSANLNGYEQQILNQINAIRQANGLNALAANQALTNIARQRSADMLSRGYFSHYTPEGTNIFNYLKANGIGYRNAGENLAQSQPASAGSPEVFANAWMNSPTHAANILRAQYGSIGIGIAENGGRRVVTTVFTN